jgi:hypothetical protein
MAIKSIIRSGDIIMLSHGDYSDYSVDGVFTAAKTFNYYTAQNDFIADHRKETGSHDSPGPYGFSAWLVQRGYVVEIDAYECHWED